MKLGRNDPCHCNSGRKYKHCHYEEDRIAEAEALRAAAEKRAAELAVAEEDGEGSDAAPAKPTDKGSRFLRESSRGSRGQAGASAGRTPRATRGSQRGS